MEEEVGEQIVRITENALRYSFDSKEESTKEKQKQLKPEDQWSCKRSPESAAYTNKHV